VIPGVRGDDRHGVLVERVVRLRTNSSEKRSPAARIDLSPRGEASERGLSKGLANDVSLEVVIIRESHTDRRKGDLAFVVFIRRFRYGPWWPIARLHCLTIVGFLAWTQKE
jgi:hypothetical protein